MDCDSQADWEPRKSSGRISMSSLLGIARLMLTLAHLVALCSASRGSGYCLGGAISIVFVAAFVSINGAMPCWRGAASIVLIAAGSWLQLLFRPGDKHNDSGCSNLMIAVISTAVTSCIIIAHELTGIKSQHRRKSSGRILDLDLHYWIIILSLWLMWYLIPEIKSRLHRKISGRISEPSSLGITAKLMIILALCCASGGSVYGWGGAIMFVAAFGASAGSVSCCRGAISILSLAACASAGSVSCWRGATSIVLIAAGSWLQLLSRPGDKHNDSDCSNLMILMIVVISTAGTYCIIIAPEPTGIKSQHRRKSSGRILDLDLVYCIIILFLWLLWLLGPEIKSRHHNTRKSSGRISKSSLLGITAKLLIILAPCCASGGSVYCWGGAIMLVAAFGASAGSVSCWRGAISILSLAACASAGSVSCWRGAISTVLIVAGSWLQLLFCPGDKHDDSDCSSHLLAVISSAKTSCIPIAHELTGNKSQHHSDSYSWSVERSIIKAVRSDTSATWVIATGAPHHATGNRALLTRFITEHDDVFVHAIDEVPMRVLARGAIVTDAMVLPDVWFVPGLCFNMVSVSQLISLKYSVSLDSDTCYIRSAADGKIVGKGQVGEAGIYVLDFLKVSLAI